MRKVISKLVNNLPLQIVVIVASIVLAILVPAAMVLGWGPERPTYTAEVPADHVTFNSITNNPSHGDERNFMQIREREASNETYADDMSLTPGKEYVVYVYYHNNAAENLNASGVGVAQGAFARAEVPAVVPNGQTKQAAAHVGAANATPKSVYDDIRLSNNSGGDIALRYVPGSTTIHNFGATNGATMPDTILSGNGVALGYNALDGVLPGCNEYAGFVTFRIKADQPNFTFKKEVRLHSTKEWKDSIAVPSGSKVDYLLSYTNTGSTKQSDVVLKDQLPEGVKYIPGSSFLMNANNPAGKVVDDGIEGTGLNIGAYEPGSNALLRFSAIVEGEPCAVRTNIAAVETKNGSMNDNANVQIEGDCAPVEELPTTGPIEVIAGLMGIAAITVGAVYYFKSRRDLESALYAAQSQPGLKKSATPTIDAIAEKVGQKPEATAPKKQTTHKK